jgi:hypothetical protein
MKSRASDPDVMNYAAICMTGCERPANRDVVPADFTAKGEPDLITRAALDVATEKLRELADDLEAIDRADSCNAARTIRAVLRTLLVAGATPEKPWQRDARMKRNGGRRA